jgi:kinesin family protein 20
MYVFCFLPSELQKYQQMLEPPPSAKPFTTDVDKKLEEGQKVITFLSYQSSDS